MQRCFFIFCTKCRKDHNDGKRKKRMRKTLKRNLSYDDRNHLYYVSLYCDGEDGSRVRRTRTYPTMEQAEQVIAEYRRTQLLGGMSAPRDVFMEDWLHCSNDCIATGKGGGSRTLKPRGLRRRQRGGKALSAGRSVPAHRAVHRRAGPPADLAPRAAPQLCERRQQPECADVQHLEGAGAQLNIRDERGVYAPFRRRGGGRGLAGGERHHRGGAVSVRETETAARAGQGAATAALAAPFP